MHIGYCPEGHLSVDCVECKGTGLDEAGREAMHEFNRHESPEELGEVA